MSDIENTSKEEKGAQAGGEGEKGTADGRRRHGADACAGETSVKSEKTTVKRDVWRVMKEVERRGKSDREERREGVQG